ncbi:unnamed protein product [Euphydryas editha]|uniref:Uncharacterized protein n=1 Tax=Euphydryas editha TaxID=104508 RepID=A0AAU9UBK3_EUPED|nr:unnamed protein product [Euphydryas editha]
MGDNEYLYSDELQLELNILNKQRELSAMVDEDNEKPLCEHIITHCSVVNGVNRLKPKRMKRVDEDTIKSSKLDKKDPHPDVHITSTFLLSLNRIITPNDKKVSDDDQWVTKKTFTGLFSTMLYTIGYFLFLKLISLSGSFHNTAIHLAFDVFNDVTVESGFF